MQNTIKRIGLLSLLTMSAIPSGFAATKGAPVPSQAVVKLDMQEGRSYSYLSVRLKPTRLKDRTRDAKEIVIGGIAHNTPVVLESERSGSYGKIDLYDPVNAAAVKLEKEDINHGSRYAYISLSFLQAIRQTSSLSESCVVVKENASIIAERSSDKRIVEHSREDRTYKLTGYVRGKYYQVRVKGDLFGSNSELETGYVTRNSIKETLAPSECEEKLGEEYHDLSWGYVQGFWQDRNGRIFHIFANEDRELQVIHYQYAPIFDGEGKIDPLNLNGVAKIERFRGSAIERVFNLYLDYMTYREDTPVQIGSNPVAPMKAEEGLPIVNLRPYFHWVEFLKSQGHIRFNVDGLNTTGELMSWTLTHAPKDEDQGAFHLVGNLLSLGEAQLKSTPMVFEGSLSALTGDFKVTGSIGEQLVQCRFEFESDFPFFQNISLKLKAEVSHEDCQGVFGENYLVSQF